jgi:hypothetical protein
MTPSGIADRELREFGVTRETVSPFGSSSSHEFCDQVQWAIGGLN